MADPAAARRRRRRRRCCCCCPPLLLLLLLLTCLTGLEAAGPPGDGGGWSLESELRLQDEGLCNVDVLDASALSHRQFLERYAFTRPVILRGLTDNTEYVDVWLRPQSSDVLGSGPGSGVPFHWHGPGFSEVIYGRKRWFLYPPHQEPHFHPNRTTLSWVTETYPLLPEAEAPLECTISPGEVLYFPDRWWHATLNLETSVFISTFLG
ncbi:JmjC domain-containing protein 8 [Liparis tanakae]|uniref:JmjC domain-containing protein 8 n=1 Tax=Liparis tanakae TaxID=230148 RepID=A0A4Z2FC71_9TELE|nr:JmjC domain-containing protein 8 [Liparis tanakae]